jgi:hypothetical protein
MLNDKQAAALKRVTKKLTAMRQTLTKDERQVLDLLIVGATTEVKGHRMADQSAVSSRVSSKVSKRASAAAEVQGHTMIDTRIGAMKDVNAMRDGGALKDVNAAAEVQGHMLTTAGALKDAGAVHDSGAAQDVRASVVFNAATSGYMVTFK